MIITVTPNPSIDRSQSLSGPLDVGGVNRVASGVDQAGGKGINVATVVHHADHDVLALAPADPGSDFADLVRASDVPARFIANGSSGGTVRVNLTLTDADGVTTKINSPGDSEATGENLADAVAQTLTDVTSQHLDGPHWLVLAGSLPPGYPDNWYATMTATAHEMGFRVAVDTSDAALTALVDLTDRNPAAAPDLIKPNSHELAQITGGDGDAMETAAESGELDGVVTAASSLLDRGFGAALVSLGAAGALLVSRDDDSGAGHSAWFCPSPSVTAVSTVGAGDSTLAGYVIGAVRGLPAPDRLALAVVHGSTAVTLPGTTLPTPHDLPATLPQPRSA
ncbi:MAG TPA: 1-phosphofructokinase family hexose kinase [Candidatus Corynebacterium avicola]|uniref:1-phosphofructokinase family hexose kinase n=1 Tax=Candidatus Corynebacterium avicola TaxID=2838527 RepID=A0A9D1RPX0_9CORY|nr:1-phosphofructokinase family hexose kinase [Candidatus Corynebacterium avicola]